MEPDYLFTQMDLNTMVRSYASLWLFFHQGSFVGGKRHGQGVYLYVNGDVYQGEWEEDVKHGDGTLLVIMKVRVNDLRL